MEPDRIIRSSWFRLYLGYAPGTAKSYAMLEEGRRRMRRGADVAIGWLETLDRQNVRTAIGELELIPARPAHAGNSAGPEMDLDAILRRRPQIALIDEIAHANAPGTKNQKRYQDVVDLISSGISVIGTLDVQNLAGVQAAVNAIAGVQERETVPDWLLDLADELELVDQTAESIERRIERERLGSDVPLLGAVKRSRLRERLLSMRDLTIRCITEHNGNERADLPARGETALNGTGLVLVCLPASQLAQPLIRRGIHLAQTSKSRLIVLHIMEAGAGVPADPPEDEIELRQALRLARELGAEVLVQPASRSNAALIAAVERVRPGDIVIGEERNVRFRGLGGRSLLQELLRRTTNVTIHVVSRAEQ
jgi:two-component system sensor histidine kinase KdpD